VSIEPKATVDAAENAAEETSDAALRAMRWKQVGVGFGIGSAALVAALLYTNQKKPKSK